MEGRVAYFITRFHEMAERDAHSDDYWESEKDWLAYEEELHTFLEKEATEEEQRILCDEYWIHMESTFMMCSGYRYARAKLLIEQYQTEGRTPELEAEVREFLQGRTLSSENELLEEHLPADFFS